MRLKKLIQALPEIEVKGSKEIEISGISSRSNLVAPGDLFIAKRGQIHDGTKFIPDAIRAGAVAVLTDLYDPFIQAVQLIHPNAASIAAKLASIFYDYPSKALHMVGITGTNGKTTTSFLVKHLLDRLGIASGLIGTVEWIVGSHRFSSEMTTPDVVTCHKLLREMATCCAKGAVMEVSSHALDQGRVDYVDFDIALFTNLSQDHLDYHGSMDEYKGAKELLFNSLGSDKWAVLNADEPFSPATQANILSYSIENAADVMAKNIKLSKRGTQFDVCFEGEERVCTSPLIGKFNVYNYLAALCAGLASGFSLEECICALKTFKSVPGRLERVRTKNAQNVFVDFAHTPDALHKVLDALKPLKKGKLITVFGCGGDRDKDKRAKMGEISSHFSDFTIVTSDNPRSEDPSAIARDILQGISGEYVVELDRKKAIQRALSMATSEDIVLIAGKGHEKEQIFAYQVVPFDDVEVAKA